MEIRRLKTLEQILREGYKVILVDSEGNKETYDVEGEERDPDLVYCDGGCGTVMGDSIQMEEIGAEIMASSGSMEGRLDDYNSRGTCDNCLRRNV